MHSPIGVIGFLFALALGVVMVVFDGFEMPGGLVFGAQRVIQAHREGPMVTLVGVSHQVCHNKVAERRPEVLGCPGTDTQGVCTIRGVGGIDNEAIDPGNGFMPCFRDDQRIGKTQHMLPLWLAQTQVQTTQKGQEFGRMLYNELEQGGILSGVCFWVALLAYTDILLCSIWGAVPLSRESSFNVPSAHQPGRKDAPWKLKVNGVTTPLAPTAARLTRTTSKCTATLKDAFAAPPVNALSVQTRARSLKHCAPHARSSWTSLRCSSSATACGLSAESNTVQLMPRCTGWSWPGSKAPPSIAPSSGMCLRRRCRSMNSGALSKKTSASATG